MGRLLQPITVVVAVVLVVGALSLSFAGCTPGALSSSGRSPGDPDRALDPDASVALDAGVTPQPRIDAGPAPDADAATETCSGMLESAPYADHVANDELTDPASCVGCPSAFTGLEELDVSLTPGATTITIDGASPGASHCAWYVLGGECGVTHGAMSTDPDGSGLFSATLPVFCGTNLVRIVCENPAGARVYVRQVAGAACDGRDLRVTLGWDERANDLELHLVREGGRINDTASDCTWFTCVGAPLDWGVPGDATDDPSKDIDALGTFGPENIFLTSAAPGTYHVYVEYWGHGEPSAASVAVAIDETTVAELRIDGFQVHDVWDVGTLSFPGGTFTPIDAVVPCQAEWGAGGSRGCGLALP